jgi:hypothetical protein
MFARLRGQYTFLPKKRNRVALVRLASSTSILEKWSACGCGGWRRWHGARVLVLCRAIRKNCFESRLHVGRGWWKKEISKEYPSADGEFIKNFKKTVYRLNDALLEA